jgi:hypothetical protein
VYDLAVPPFGPSVQSELRLIISTLIPSLAAFLLPSGGPGLGNAGCRRPNRRCRVTGQLAGGHLRVKGWVLAGEGVEFALGAKADAATSRSILRPIKVQFAP